MRLFVVTARTRNDRSILPSLLFMGYRKRERTEADRKVVWSRQKKKPPRKYFLIEKLWRTEESIGSRFDVFNPFPNDEASSLINVIYLALSLFHMPSPSLRLM